jgi:hypothetical protein
VSNISYDNISLLIIGYDPYKDVWDHYFDLLEKYWPDRPRTYLATNTITPAYKNVTDIPCGADAEWSRKVYQSLDKIPTDYVILLLEDFFTTRPVNGERFEKLITFLERHKVDYCKLLNQSKIIGPAYEEKHALHILSENTTYGVSLQPAFWKKSFLKELVGPENYNAWNFEFTQVKNKTHTRKDITCLGETSNVLEITHAVVQSKYLRSAIRTFKKQGYTIDTTVRPAMSAKDDFKYNLKLAVNHKAPKWLKPALKSIGRKMHVDFVSDRMGESK